MTGQFVGNSAHFDVRHRRRRAASVRSAWRDGLVAAAWLTTVAILGFFLATGPMSVTGSADLLNAFGRFTGLIATNIMLIQVALASRAPWIERVVGHDKAAKIHGQLGEPVFYLLVAHAAFLTLGWGAPLGLNPVQQTEYFWNQMPNMALAIVSLAVLLLVGVSSVAAVRKRWPYETWHAIHLMTYVAVGLSIPHQFYDGTTFTLNQPAKWYWLGLYVVAFGSMLVWRLAVPMWRAVRHGLYVSDIIRHDDGTVTLTVQGRHLERWYARPGQFFLWRFWTPSLWLTAHPYSLSAAPDGRSLRITVKPLGDDSSALRTVRPGTRVSASGPYGVFTHDHRVNGTLVLVGAGIGITPLRAMAEDVQAYDGDTHVIVRARSYIEAPLLDELERLCQERGFFLHVSIGPRGDGWAANGGPTSLYQMVPDISDADVYVCGPESWADAVAKDARYCGVDADAIHREEYAW